MMRCEIIKREGKFHVQDVRTGRLLSSSYSRRQARRDLRALQIRGEAEPGKWSRWLTSLGLRS